MDTSWPLPTSLIQGTLGSGTRWFLFVQSSLWVLAAVLGKKSQCHYGLYYVSTMALPWQVWCCWRPRATLISSHHGVTQVVCLVFLPTKFASIVFISNFPLYKNLNNLAASSFVIFITINPRFRCGYLIQKCIGYHHFETLVSLLFKVNIISKVCFVVKVDFIYKIEDKGGKSGGGLVGERLLFNWETPNPWHNTYLWLSFRSNLHLWIFNSNNFL